MRILITGGLGFIGRTLTQQFLEEGGHEIVLVDILSEQVHGPDPDYSALIDRPEVTFMHQDICTPGVLAKALDGVDLVCHLAAETGTGQSMYQIEQYYRTNVTGTAILMEEIVRSTDKRPARVILSSSRSVYGEGAYVAADVVNDDQAIRHYPTARSSQDMEIGRFDFEVDGMLLKPVATQETDPVDPRSLYAASKLSQEHICQIACSSVGVPYTALRLQNVYGPGQSLRNPYTGIMSIFTNILRQDGIINIFEDGEESRDFVYVADVARAFRAAARMSKDGPEVINVGTGDAVSVIEMVRILEEKLDLVDRHRISGDFRPGDIRHNWADIRLMQTHLGLEPKIDLKAGLSITVDWALTQPVEEDRSSKAAKELKDILKG